MRGLDAAISAWERQQPPEWDNEDCGWCECDTCKGKGLLPNPADENDPLPCELCGCEGGWDEHGEPISEADYEARKDREADDYAASRYEDKSYE